MIEVFVMHLVEYVWIVVKLLMVCDCRLQPIHMRSTVYKLKVVMLCAVHHWGRQAMRRRRWEKGMTTGRWWTCHRTRWMSSSTFHEYSLKIPQASAVLVMLVGTWFQ
jgi:hypothetical protein